MSYTPTEWHNGDTITAAKMNKLEEGVANAGGIVFVTETVTMDGSTEIHTLNNTIQEIYDYIAGGNIVLVKYIGEIDSSNEWHASYDFIRSVDYYPGEGYFIYFNGGNYSAESLSDYPSYVNSEPV